MLNKRIIVLTVFVVSLIAVSSVSAADGNSSEMQNAVDNEDIEATFNQNVNIAEKNLNTTGSFSDLNEEIAKSGGELNLTRNYSYSDNDSNYQDGILIDKPITINGNGFTINGNNQATAFTINAGNVFLRNLSFVNCSGYRGGAISWSNSINAYLNNCDFNACSAVYGGAIFFNNTDCFLSDCNFAACSVGGNGGAIYCYITCNAYLNNCGFVGCSAWDGGAITSLGMLYLNNATFINNSAWDGGAIYSVSEVDLNNSIFINNSALSGGGAISSFITTCKDSIFISNTAEDFGGALWVDELYLSNVSFINNSALEGGGAIYNLYFLMCECSEFINNVASYGDAIYITGAVETNVDGCYFESKDSTFSLIYGTCTDLFVYNSIFANTSSKYAPAIFITNASLMINNSQFINLKSGESAGAVAVKVFDSVTVENCKFINTSSVKNGGAIFIDSHDYVGIGASEVYLSNTSFVNVSGDFGGAYVQLCGKLNMSDSMFVNCTSKYDGGAVYLAHVDAGEIKNCTFNSNKVTLYGDYPTFGGAIYVDNTKIDIFGSKFVNNSAFVDSGVIGLYDSLYHIENSTFDNGGVAVHAIFKKDGSEVINCSGNDTISDENVFYPQMVAGSAINLTLITNEINVENLPIRFDLRDYNWTSPVKDQGIKGFCWGFATVDSLESELLKSSGLSFDFSENNLNTMLIYSKYGSDEYEGGYSPYIASYVLSWLGAVSQDYDSYDELGKISPVFVTSDKVHIQDVVIIDKNPGIIDDSILKQVILRYGAFPFYIAGASLQNEEASQFYNPETYAFYASDYVDSNHMVCVVGWDDAFSRDNFHDTPLGDGAWICKNSWGPDWGDGGYFYVSYYDKSFQDSIVVFLVENTVPYNKNYQYDFNGLNSFHYLGENDEMYGRSINYANKFVAEGDDLIAGVGTYFNQSGINYTIKIEVNGKTVLTQEGISPYYGYHTIKLDNYISIKDGDEFLVYVTSNVLPVSRSPNLHYRANVSMTDSWGNWTDIFAKNGTVACIKAYTVEDGSKIISNKDISVDYAGGKCFSVKVSTADGHIVVGGDVKFTINGKTKTVKTDKNGIAKIKITQNPGKYTIKATYNGKTYTNKVTVKHVLTANKVTVKKTSKKFVLKAKLKINGKLVKGKTVTFKFNGKTYKVKTNSKGVAQKTLNKKVIKKLKKGKNYTVKVTYLKNTIKTTVKVK